MSADASPSSSSSSCAPAKKKPALSLPPKHKLVYFDIPGRGEPIRLALTFAGIPFEDYRMKRDEWASLKPKMKFGQVPMLQVPAPAPAPMTSSSSSSTNDSGSAGDDSSGAEPQAPAPQELFQTMSILRYVGRISPRSGLYPVEDPVLCAHIDGVLDNCGDFCIGQLVYRYGPRFGFSLSDDVKAAVAAELISQNIPHRLAAFEKLLERSATGWFLGTPGPTIAEFFICPLFRDFEDGNALFDLNKPKLQGVLTRGFPRLKQLVDKFYAVPEIKAYYAARQAGSQ